MRSPITRSEVEDLKDEDGDPISPAADQVIRHRRIALRLGLVIGAVALVIGAIVAPNLTLLVFVLLAGFGIAGIVTGRLSRQLGLWIDQLFGANR